MKSALTYQPFLFSLFLLISSFGSLNGMTIRNLRCDYLSNPIAVDNPVPVLSWQLQSDKRGQLQSAYRILVADSPALLKKNKANVWDSGVVRSDRSTQIRYGGRTLVSREALI